MAHTSDVREKVLVCEHHTLRVTGGARGIHDGLKVVLGWWVSLDRFVLSVLFKLLKRYDCNSGGLNSNFRIKKKLMSVRTFPASLSSEGTSS